MSMTINAAGGGVGLNFSIICDVTQPTPRENMIWVNTGTPLDGYAFASSAPAAPRNGMVWILTANSSAVAFNAAKKGILMVYPVTCKQYISGAWTDVTAKSYINNGWRDWIVYLYSPGNTYADLTGGWEGVAHRRYATLPGESWDVYSKAPSVNTGGTEYMEIVLESQQYSNYSGSARTRNKIDLTGFDQISFTLTVAGGSPKGYVTTSPTGYDNVTEVDLGVGTTALDVSGLSGEHYVGINLLAASATMTTRVTQITVE